MSEKELVLPRAGETNEKKAVMEETTETKKEMTQEESEAREKVFFEEDEKVRLRDGKTYYIPPLALKDARKLMKMLNTIDSSIIIANLIPDNRDGDDRYNQLTEVLLMAFKPYYSNMTVEHLEEYVDIESARKIIDCMIGLNQLKKSL